jgi:NitT/TauT family transport system substrate-binding protein
MSLNSISSNSISSNKLTRRKFIQSAAMGAAAVSTGFSFPRPAISKPIQVSYTLSWLPTGQYAYLYAARQLGYFKKRGIDLDISRGFGSMAANQAVAIGKFQMGGAQTGANLLGLMRGLDLRLLGTQGYDATLGIVALKKGPIKTPRDLEGRTIGVSAAGGDTAFLPAYCKLAGIDFDKLKVVQLDSKILEQSAMSGVVDSIVVTGLSSIPNFVSEEWKTALQNVLFPIEVAGCDRSIYLNRAIELLQMVGLGDASTKGPANCQAVCGSAYHCAAHSFRIRPSF